MLNLENYFVYPTSVPAFPSVVEGQRKGDTFLGADGFPCGSRELQEFIKKTK